MREEVKRIMSRVFSIDEGCIPENVSYGDFEKWDSIQHLNLVVELESFYKVNFDPEEIQTMINLDKIVSVIGQKRA